MNTYAAALQRKTFSCNSVTSIHTTSHDEMSPSATAPDYLVRSRATTVIRSIFSVFWGDLKAPWIYKINLTQVEYQCWFLAERQDFGIRVCVCVQLSKLKWSLLPSWEEREPKKLYFFYAGGVIRSFRFCGGRSLLPCFGYVFFFVFAADDETTRREKMSSARPSTVIEQPSF